MDVATTHVNADLDGLASLVAVNRLHGPMALALPGGMDPETHRVWNEHSAAFPVLMRVRTLRRHLVQSELGRLFVVDTSDPERLGFIKDHVARFAEVRAFDTHPPHPGALPREAMPSAGACISALVLMLRDADIAPTAEEAGLFLLGIHQETGHFSFGTTTAVDHQAAACCWQWGAPAEWPSKYVQRGFTRAQLLLLERMAHSVEFVEEGGHTVALMDVELDAYQPDLAVLVEQLREAEQWPAALLVASQGERAFCIGRSRMGLDMAAILRALGGGGHPEAASAVLRQVTLADARKVVKATLVELMGRQLTALKVAAQPVFALPSTTTIRDVADALHQRRFNAIPITETAGGAARYVGVVQRMDVDAALRHGLGARPVVDVMAQAPTWVAADTPLHQVRRQLVAGPRRLILVGEPPAAAVGVLTRGQVLRSGELPFDPREAGGHPPPHLVLAMVRKQLGAAWEHVEALAALGIRTGTSVFLVGGTVRDMFLGTQVRDLDVLVEGHAPDLARAARDTLGGWISVREAFATATWRPPGGTAIDLASSRSEYYEKPAALPKVAHAGLQQDLYRRDFTVNAMAVALVGPEAGKILDPYGGMADLRDGVLRVLHGVSFHDDPTRMFRAARFAARFDFRLAPDTAGLLKAARQVGVLERLTDERLGAELELIVNEREVVQVFRLLREWGLLDHIHPNLARERTLLTRLADARSSRFRFQGLREEGVSQGDVLWLALATMVPEDVRRDRVGLIGGGRQRRSRWFEGPQRIKATRAPLARVRKASRAARILEPLDTVELIVAFASASSVRGRDWIVWWFGEGHKITRAIDGRALLTLGYPPGPALRRGLEVALDLAREGASPEMQLAQARRAVEQHLAGYPAPSV